MGGTTKIFSYWLRVRTEMEKNGEWTDATLLAKHHCKNRWLYVCSASAVRSGHDSIQGSQLRVQLHLKPNRRFTHTAKKTTCLEFLENALRESCVHTGQSSSDKNQRQLKNPSCPTHPGAKRPICRMPCTPPKTKILFVRPLRSSSSLVSEFGDVIDPRSVGHA